MFVGIVWLMVGTLIGAAVGYIISAGAAAGGAAGFLIALALLIVGARLGIPATDAAGRFMSSDSETPSTPQTPTRVSGTAGRDGKVVREPTESMVAGVREVRGFVIEWDSLEVDDPRLSGRVTVALNANAHQEADGIEVVPQALSLRIENEDGTWFGSGTSLSRGRGMLAPDEATNLDTIVLTGMGAYEGLSAYLIMDGTASPATVEGAIFAGGLPPAPQLPAE